MFFSNNILSCSCKEAFINSCTLQQKIICVKNLNHFKEIFEFAALVFANIKNMSRNLLYIKLNLEKFERLLSDLKKLIQLKHEYYKSLSENLKKKVSSDKLYKITFKLKKIEIILTEESNKLASYITLIPQQIMLCKSICIPIEFFQIFSNKKPLTEILTQVLSQINHVINFIQSLLNPKKAINISSSSVSPNKSIKQDNNRSFIFQIFHIRSILLKKLQPFTLSMNLKKSSTTLISYMQESPILEKKIKNFKTVNINIVRDSKFKNFSLSRHTNQSYNSS